MIITNEKVFKKFLNKIPKQINFACSRTLNKKVKDAEKAVEKHIASHFDTTTSWYKAGNKFGARSKKSNKSKLEAYVFMARGGSIVSLGAGAAEHWIFDHEDGEIRRAKEGDEDGDILIPTKALLSKIDSTKGKKGRRKVRKFTNKNRNVLFDADIKGNTYLMSRSKKLVTGTRRGRTPTGRLTKRPKKVQARAIPIFLKKKQVKIKNVLDFHKVAIKAVEKDFNKTFDDFFEQAMATMR